MGILFPLYQPARKDSSEPCTCGTNALRNLAPYDEYLLSLMEMPHSYSLVPFQNRLKVGDVILVKGPLKPRPFWVLGVVMEVISGGDGVVRLTQVK